MMNYHTKASASTTRISGIFEMSDEKKKVLFFSICVIFLPVIKGVEQC